MGEPEIYPAAGKGGSLEIRLIVLSVICLIAAIMDIYSCKVRNYLIITGVLTGYLFNCHIHGIQGLAVSTAGLLIPLLSMMAFYRLRMFGAGDLKLFAMTGAFTGPKDIVFIMVAALVAGAVIGGLKIILSEEREGPVKIRFAIPTFVGVAAYSLGLLF
ncbi:MAG TPA: hypothetical protein DCL38_11105 [Lachnospiraceae bacterium]|nr:hypothetical protein [Lachnospiraceae bacterium]